MDDDIRRSDVRDWLERLRGSFSNPNQRTEMIAKLRSIGPDRLFPLLQECFRDPDGEWRCLAASAIYHTDPEAGAGVPLLLPLLEDSETVVRWHVCGLMHDFGDRRAVPSLIRILKTEPDPQVRNTAAHALGGIGDPTAIPALLFTLDNDHEFDELGYSAALSAAGALDDILRTHHTRIRISENFCTLQPKASDLNALKSAAIAYYRSRSEDCRQTPAYDKFIYFLIIFQ